MEYNTQREKLKISDYGRTVVKMIDYAKHLEDREERTRMAEVIIDVMAHLNPKVKERTDYKHILWDHLMIIAGNDLDVDCPYPINLEEAESFHPHQLQLHDNNIHYRHYGHVLEDMIHTVAEMPGSEEREALTIQLAQTMKKLYLQWNRDTVDDQLIIDQLDELSGGRLTLPDGFQFADSKELLAEIEIAQNSKSDGGKKKKKKKKKKTAA